MRALAGRTLPFLARSWQSKRLAGIEELPRRIVKNSESFGNNRRNGSSRRFCQEGDNNRYIDSMRDFDCMSTENHSPLEWKACEIAKSLEYERKGCLVIPTGSGSDFFVACSDQKPTFVEVKNGCGGLTRLQRQTQKNARENGFDYKIERCNCNKSEQFSACFKLVKVGDSSNACQILMQIRK